MKVVPNLRGIRPEGVRFGVRPMPKDGHSIVGFDPVVEGFYHAVMHSGVTLSTVVGSLVTDDCLGVDPPELEPYRPARFDQQAALTLHSTNE